MRTHQIILIATILLMPPLAYSSEQVVGEAGDWTKQVSVDEMDGSESRFATTSSKNELKGKVREEHIVLTERKVLLGMDCKSGLYLRSNGLGFFYQENDGRKSQNGRMKVDDKSPVSVTFRVWKHNNNGMTVVLPQTGEEGAREYYDLLLDMKAGKELMIEVKLQHTNARAQIARFSLMGFTNSWEWCGWGGPE